MSPAATICAVTRRLKQLFSHLLNRFGYSTTCEFLLDLFKVGLTLLPLLHLTLLFFKQREIDLMEVAKAVELEKIAEIDRLTAKIAELEKLVATRRQPKRV